MYTLEPAKLNDIEICSMIIDDARKFQREQGFIQWSDNYPNINTLEDDVKNKKGYVIRTEDDIAGYMCIDFSGEPDYEDIQGEWRTNEQYAVIHRMAFNKEFRGTGLSNTAFRLIAELCVDNNIPNIRIDTHPANKRMQHVLLKNGFTYCGVILFEGDDRWAYDKIIIPTPSF